MSNREFTATRTMLANAFATAGAASTIPAQVPAAEVRVAALGNLADAIKRAVNMLPVDAAGALIAAFGEVAHQSTADKASEVRAASPSGRYWAIHEGDLLGVLSVNIGAAYVDPIAAAKRCRVTIYPLPAAPSTADSAGTGAMGEGTDHA